MDVLIRDVEPAKVNKIKLWAKKRNRSLQAELKIIVEGAAERREPLSDLEVVRMIRASNTKVNKSNSVDLLREDRDR